jgi:type IV pilus assembly protein PilV
MRARKASLLFRNQGRAFRAHLGASMIEVLVALLIISLGLLGIGGISAATFGYNKAAQLRLTGLSLVNDYADRARLNVYGYDLGSYAIELDDDVPSADDVEDAEGALVVNEAAAATAAANVAQFDRALFQRTVADRLPQGRAIVVTNPTVNARNIDVWLLWREPQTDLEDSLFLAGQFNCPDDLSEEDQAVYSCMYFKVGL